MMLWTAIVTTARAADPGVAFTFKATVSDVQDNNSLLGNNIQAGTVLTGTISYRVDAQNKSLRNNQGAYEFTSGAGIVIQGGGLTFATDPASTKVRVEIVHEIVQAKRGDVLLIRSYNNLPLNNNVAVDHISWQIEDRKGRALSNAHIPSASVTLASWKSTQGITIEGSVPPDTGQRFRVRAHLTELVKVK